MMKMNSSKLITVVTESFISFKNGKPILSPRGSEILLYSIIKNILKEKNINFEVYQLGFKDLEVKFDGILVKIIKSNNFNNFKKKLRKIKFNGEIIHYNNIDLFNGKIPNSYITATIHTNVFLEKENARKWLSKHMKDIDEIIAVNKSYKREFKSVKLIKNGVSTKIFNYNPHKKNWRQVINILFPNLNSPKKNRAFAINLVKELNKRNKFKFKLILTGEEEKLPLKKEEYEFIGKKHWGKEMNTLYQDSFLTIIPSISESCSLCALESMASGTPVIANHITGISDYIKNDFNGYLISVNDINAWINRIFYLIENPKEYKRIQRSARNALIKEYNLERVSNEYYSMWLTLLRRRNE